MNFRQKHYERVTSMESTKHGVTQSLTLRLHGTQLGLLLIVTVDFSTFVN